MPPDSDPRLTFTADDLTNCLNALEKSMMPGAQAEMMVDLKRKIRAAIEWKA